jgi:hypothetical protein
MLLFMDGFDKYGATADMTVGGRGWTNADTTHFTFDATGGRWGAGALKCTEDATANDFKTGTLGNSAGDEAHVAFNIFSDGIIASQVMCCIKRGSNADQAQIGVDSNKKLYASGYDASGYGAIVTESVASLHDSTDHHVEIHYKAANSGGFAKVWVDNVLVIDFSGDTLGSASSWNWGQIVLGGIGGNTWIDDVVVWQETSGGVTLFNPSHLGPHRIETLTPAAEGTSAQFTPQSGSNNAAMVDDVGTPNGTDYVDTGTTPGNLDLYTHNTLSGAPTAIYAVSQTSIGFKSGNDTATIRHQYEVSGTTNESGDIDSGIGSTTARKSYLGQFNGGSWSVANITSLQIGMKLTASAGGKFARIIDFYGEVLEDFALPIPPRNSIALVGG